MDGWRIQEIADYCQRYGYDFRIALRTAARDGVPWYVPNSTSKVR